MKHENNFLLYSIASAFLMVSGMMLVSSAHYERSLNLLANIVTVTAVVPEKENHNIYSISGSVNGLDVDSRQVLKVSLWRESGDGSMRQVESRQLDSVTGFYYSFENLRSGLYAIKLETSDGVQVVEPKPFVQGISRSSHIMFVLTSPDILQYTTPNFVVLESL